MPDSKNHINGVPRESIYTNEIYFANKQLKEVRKKNSEQKRASDQD